MNETTHWFLAQAQQEVHPLIAVSDPFWPEAVKWVEEQGDKKIQAPMLFTSLEQAEDELREHNASAPDSYLGFIEKYGEEVVNEAFDNSAPLHVFGLPAELLADKLDEAEIPYVMVDEEIKSRGNLIQQLRHEAGDDREDD